MSENIANVLYWISRQVFRIINILQQMFDLFAGGAEVSFNGNAGFLSNLFISHNVIELAYMAFAIFGVLLSIGLALFSIMRRIFDAGGRGTMTVGRIISSVIKCIALISITNGVVTAVFSATNMILSYVHYSAEIKKGEDFDVEFDDEMRAAMARALNTLGNYSLNDSYTESININMCFNDMRSDLLILDNANIFDIDYDTKNNGNSWQSVLADVADSADLSADLDPAEEYPQVTAAIVNAMEIIRTNRQLPVLMEVSVPGGSFDTVKSFDTVLFLLNTMDAAKSDKYKENPDINDPLRSKFMTGTKSIYDIEDVTASFDITAINYVIMFLSAIWLIFDLGYMLFVCITRFFSLIFLYIMAPGFFAVMPVDDGSRTREWIKMFLVQASAVFVTMIPMKLIILFLPMIMDEGLVFFDGGYINQMVKLLLMLGLFETARRTIGVVSKLIMHSNPGSALGSYEIKTLSRSISKGVGKEFKKAIRRLAD